MFILKRKGEILIYCKLLLGIGRKDRIIIKNCYKKINLIFVKFVFYIFSL